LELPEPRKTNQQPEPCPSANSDGSEAIQCVERPAPVEESTGALTRFRNAGKVFIYFELLMQGAFYILFGVVAVIAILVAFITGEYRLLAEYLPGALIFLGLLWFVRWIVMDARKFNKSKSRKRRPRFEFQEEQEIDATNIHVKGRDPEL
jgi:hypothetical protein